MDVEEAGVAVHHLVYCVRMNRWTVGVATKGAIVRQSGSQRYGMGAEIAQVSPVTSKKWIDGSSWGKNCQSIGEQ